MPKYTRRADTKVPYVIYSPGLGVVEDGGFCTVYSDFDEEAREFRPTHVQFPDDDDQTEIRFAKDQDSNLWPVYEFARDPWAVIALDHRFFHEDTGFAVVPF